MATLKQGHKKPDIKSSSKAKNNTFWKAAKIVTGVIRKNFFLSTMGVALIINFFANYNPKRMVGTERKKEKKEIQREKLNEAYQDWKEDLKKGKQNKSENSLSEIKNNDNPLLDMLASKSFENWAEQLEKETGYQKETFIDIANDETKNSSKVTQEMIMKANGFDADDVKEVQKKYEIDTLENKKTSSVEVDADADPMLDFAFKNEQGQEMVAEAVDLGNRTLQLTHIDVVSAFADNTEDMGMPTKVPEIGTVSAPVPVV